MGGERCRIEGWRRSSNLRTLKKIEFCRLGIFIRIFFSKFPIFAHHSIFFNVDFFLNFLIQSFFWVAWRGFNNSNSNFNFNSNQWKFEFGPPIIKIQRIQTYRVASKKNLTKAHKNPPTKARKNNPLPLNSHKKTPLMKAHMWWFTSYLAFSEGFFLWEIHVTKRRKIEKVRLFCESTFYRWGGWLVFFANRGVFFWEKFMGVGGFCCGPPCICIQ